MDKILLVAREKELHDEIPPLMENCGVEIQHSHGLGDVFERLSSQKYTLIVCEYRLGSMTGLDLLKILKISHPETRLMLLLDEADEKVAEKARQEGSSLVVVRPFENDFLVQEIQKLTSSGQSDTLEREIQRYNQPDRSIVHQQERKEEPELLDLLAEPDEMPPPPPDAKSQSVPSPLSPAQQPSPVPRRVPHVELEVSQDSMRVYLSCVPRRENPFSLEDVDKIASEKGIVHGLNREKIEALLQRASSTSKSLHRELVGLGSPPVDGFPRRVQIFHGTYISWEIPRSGSIDFFL